MKTTLKVVCMYCGCAIGEKDGKGVSGVSHGICRDCWGSRFPPDWEYPEDKPEYGENRGEQK